MPAFSGWPKEALTFLADLEANNDRDWFKANRGRYDASCAEPALALGADLSDLGTPKLFRPWNDTRFRPGPPLKEHVGLAVGYEGAGGWYVQLALDGVMIAAGLHSPKPDQVARLRAAIDDGRKAAALTRGLAVARAAGLTLNDPDLLRVPRGFDADHPRAELLRRRSLTVSVTMPPAAWLHKPAAYAHIRESLDAATPMVNWLRRHVGPTQATSR
ncbi:hypothetical protein DSM112329_02546 [Paraconexibacter sp. AEG42_29]|uniref:TIGR02453 family protein n=1 Tax=Paraconexibacter sp. AEG42_29 TaxID=2997339 RepID=A0AAU7AVG6_9ACTN